MKTTAKVSFADVQERILELIAQSRRFSGFVMPESMKDEIRRCATVLCEGREGEAVRLGKLVEQGLTNLLRKFFKNSDKHFSQLIQQKDPGNYDQDVWGGLLAAYQKHFLPEVRRQDEMSVQHCADVYCYMKDMLAWVDAEQKRREHNRQVRHEEERAARLAEQAAAAESRKAQQRREAFEQRQEVADKLLAQIA